MKKFKRMIWTADTNTGGQPTRTVIAGMPRIRGKTMSEKMLNMRDNFDDIRTFLISEPRGAPNTSLAILTEPTLPEADAGVLYCESHGYMPMCGHNTIGVATMLIETGMVDVNEPTTEIALETAAGMVRIVACVDNGRVRNVTFRNAPCFLAGMDLEVEFNGKRILFDAAYGGNFYAIIDASSLDLSLRPENLRKIIETGQQIKDRINTVHEITHPTEKYLRGVSLVEFVEPLRKEGDVLLSKNTVVYSPGEVDRSPCGTGTSARLASLYARGLIGPGEQFLQKSILDTEFLGKIVDVIEDYHGFKAIVPEITGSAYLTGFHTFYFDPDDPKGEGFCLPRY